jgi:hypothetical protein
MLEMRKLTARRLSEGVEAAVELIERVIGFLKVHLAVHSYDLVPYEAQFLALAGFFRDSGEPTARQSASLMRWFWTASLNEDMQGRSEHQVARIVEQMQHLRSGRVKGLKGRLVLDISALKDRRFRWGAALSSALASMLAKKRCRSLITGSEISVDEYMTKAGGDAFVGLASAEGVKQALGKYVPAGKVIANAVVAALGERGTLRSMSPLQLLRNLKQEHPEDWEQILESQLIPPSALEALVKGRVDTFLNRRAEAILEFARTLAFPSAEA